MGRLAWQRLRRDKAAMTGAAAVLVMVALAVTAPALAVLTGHGPAQQFPDTGISSSGVPAGPGRTFWLGADELGRDLFIRIAYGARISLFVGGMATAIGTVVGVGAGLVAGYHGGWADMALSRLIDAVLAFPAMILALALAAAAGPSLAVVIGVISFFTCAGIARVVRGQTISLKTREYVVAARSFGAGGWRIMVIEILPNLIGPVLVLAMVSIPSAITFEATLSFLGLGVQPPQASWGNTLAGAENYYNVAWWYLVFPVLALLVTTLGFNLLAEGIRDALDPAPQPVTSSTSGRRRRHRLRQWRVSRIRLAGRAARQDTPPRAHACATAAAQLAATASPVMNSPPLTASGQAARTVGLAGLRSRAARRLRAWRALLVFLAGRVAAGAVVLWAVSLGTFLLFFARPAASVARSLAGKEPTTAQLQQITRQLGLDRPVLVQYWQFMTRLVHGDLGYSYVSGEPVITILARDLPPTASLVAGGVLLWLAAGISVGILSAAWPRSLADRVATMGTLAGLSMPTFVLGQVLLAGVFLQLNKHGVTWIQNGYASPAQGLPAWLGHMILPWVTVATGSAALYSRLVRSSLLETLGEDYIRTARAKGMTERRVIVWHALRPALTLVVSQLGVDVGTLLGGAVATETVFGLGGLGQGSVQAIGAGDLPVIIGLVLLATLFVVLASIITDFCYALLDPMSPGLTPRRS